MDKKGSKRLKLFKFKIKTERKRFLIKIISARDKNEVKEFIKGYSGEVKTIYIKNAAPLKDKIDNYFANKIGKNSEEDIKKEILLRAKKIKPLETARFLSRFSEATNASVKPMDIIASLLQEDFSYNMKMLFIELEENLNKGNPLHVALSIIPGLSSEALSIIKIGETTGKLPKTLDQVAKDITLKVEIKKKLKKGLMKPFFTLLFAFGIVIFIVPTMVNPIKDLFSQFGGAELPILTRIVIYSTDFITNNAPFIGIALFLLIIFINIGLKKSYNFKLNYDRLILNMPIIGKFIRDISTLKILVGINMYVQSAIPLSEALASTLKTINNNELREELLYISNEVDRGKNFSQALSQAVYFNDYIKGEISVAEKEGSLVKKLNQIIDILDVKISEDSEIMISGLTKTIGLLVSLIVGVVIIAVYSPMFSLMGQVNKNIMEG